MEGRERLETLLAKAKEVHDKFYSNERHDYEAIPMYFLCKGAEIEEILALADFPDEGAAKIALADMVGKHAKQIECDAYVFNCESWTIPQGADRTRGERFKDRDDRIEVLIVEARLDTQEAASTMALIKRTEGESPKLEWQEPMFSMDKGTSIQSRLNIFKPGEIPQSEFPDNTQFHREQAVAALMALLGPGR
jgi:hypothetical protein